MYIILPAVDTPNDLHRTKMEQSLTVSKKLPGKLSFENDLDFLYVAAVAKLRLAGYTASATLQSHTPSDCYFHM